MGGYSMFTRKDFIKKTVVSGVGLMGLGIAPLKVLAKKKEIVKISLLHTNDMHSHIEAFHLNDPKYPGLGGMAKRSAVINKIRAEENHVLLFDAGDVFQGTPYFNYYGGELEYKLMSYMKYNSVTIGNHDFDYGIEHLAKMMAFADFHFVASNYNFSDTPLHDKTAQFAIYNMDGIKVGVFGLGIELDGLVRKRNYGNTQYIDPIQTSVVLSHKLKKELGCHLIVCISHLGFSYKTKKISDVVLAKNSQDIDLIIGGHSHLLLKRPVIYTNKKGEKIMIAQAGWAGIALGKIDYFFERQTGKKIGSVSQSFPLS